MFQNPKYIIFLHIIPNKLFVIGKGAIGVIGAVSIKIGAEFFVYGVAHKSTRS